MGNPFENLIHVLSQELALYGRLHELLSEERDAMRALRVDDLFAAADEKDGLALQLKALEESRRLAIQSIAEQCDLEDSELSGLAAVAAVAPPHQAAALTRLGNELRERVLSGKAINDDSRFLANRSLDTLRDAIEFLAKPAEVHKTYKRKGPPRAYRIAPQVVARKV